MNQEKRDKMAAQLDKDFRWSKWQRENPNVSSKEYDKIWEKKFQELEFDKYGKQYDKFFNKEVDGLMLGKYNVGMGEMEHLGDKGFTDPFEFHFNYASLGKPTFKYSTPERSKTWEKANRISEIVGGPSLVKKISRKGIKSLKNRFGSRYKRSSRKDGIMSNRKQIEGPRFKFADDFVNRRSGPQR